MTTNLTPARASGWADAINKMGRPFLTVLMVTVYMAVLSSAVLLKDLTVKEYTDVLSPMVAMIVGFWFGERSRLNDLPQMPECPPCPNCAGGSP